MKGIVSFDYDMTLLDHGDYRIPDSASRALKALRKHYYSVLATGRDLDTKFSAGILDLVRPDGTIQLNGTKITVGDRLVYEHFMKRELVEAVLSFARGKPYSVGVTTGDRDYFTNPENIVDYDRRRWGESDRNFRDPWELPDLGVRTMTYIGEEQGVKELEAAFPQLKLPMFAGRWGADIIEKEASKARGLERLCAYYGIPMEHTVAFGDSMNDYEIVCAAGIGVAMGNGVEELKQAADYVTTPIGEDGVWNACVNLNLF